jgi:7-cyano-7-deazaguanine synthase
MAATDHTQGGALVLFSGGQDSTTCLMWALQTFERVETIGIDYGQRHATELACRDGVRAALRQRFPLWAAGLGADHVVAIPALGSLSDTALTRDVAITFSEKGLPSTFVPGRNLVMLTFAAIVAYRRGLRHLVGGMCETDFAGYPDCRDDAVKAMQLALNLGMDSRFVIHTPLMWRDKAEIWRLAEDLGGEAFVALIREETHTCYLGDRSQAHRWGYGCGACPACRLRADGFNTYYSRKQAAEGRVAG